MAEDTDCGTEGAEHLCDLSTTGVEVKALTICQPYAHLIYLKEKRVENRTWPTRYRGRMYIHAGKSREWLSEGDMDRYPNMAFGAVIATAKLIDCLRFDLIQA